ncbi:MAG: hypothetical protein WA874_04255 [Chryseosolibacter sp.]
MATLKDLETEIRQMAKFYAELSKSAEKNLDKDYAEMGQESGENILSLVEKYHSDPKNTYLKRIHSNLMTLTRGIEYFQDEDAQKKHDSYRPLVIKILRYVNENVKW